MKLEQVLGEVGHKVAVRMSAPDKRAVFLDGEGRRPPGYYALEGDVVDMATFRHDVEREEVGRRLGLADVDLDDWFPDVDVCWCETCGKTRQFRGTLA